jgi:hypothetical protein
LNSIYNAVLKFQNYITQVVAFTVYTLIEHPPVLFHHPAGRFGRCGSNFLGYCLLKTFQSLGMMLVYLGFEVAPKKEMAWGQIWRTRQPHDVTTQGDNMPGNIFLRIPSERSDVWAVA